MFHLVLICICLGAVWSSVPAGYVQIPSQSCVQNPAVTFSAYASQWPVGTSTGYVSLYFQVNTSVAITGGNYTAKILYNGYSYTYGIGDNQQLAQNEGISWPIPAGFSFEQAVPNVAFVNVGQFYPIGFDIWSFDQNGHYLMCVSNLPYTVPSSLVSIPFANCASDPSSAVTVRAWANNWPVASNSGLGFVLFQATANQEISGGTYSISITTSLQTVILSSEGNIADIAFIYAPWPIPAGFSNQVAFPFDTTTFPPGATVSFQFSLTDQLGHEYLCVMNSDAASTSISILAILVTLIFTVKNY